MKNNATSKPPALTSQLSALALSCAAVLTLAACGGGGGGGSAATPSLTPDAPPPPALAVVVPSLGDESPVPNQVEGENGAVIDSYNSDGDINLNALNHYYTDMYHDGNGNINSNITKIGQEYLLNEVGDEQYEDSYRTLINNENGTFTYVIYNREDGTDTLSVVLTTDFNNPASLSVGDVITVISGVNAAIEWKVENETVIIGSSTVAIHEDYTYKAYDADNICLEIFCEANQIYDYDFHFLQGEYAGLVFYSDISATDEVSDFTAKSYYGVFTPHENIPESAILTYDIDHAFGAYIDYNGIDKLLHGNGSLQANFYSNQILLTLDIKDHEDNAFLNVNDVELELSGNRFYLCDTCTGELDYADATGLDDVTSSLTNYIDIDGAFFGPNYEELAGGIDGIVDIIFIGQQHPETSFSLGDHSLLPLEIVTFGNVTLTTYVDAQIYIDGYLQTIKEINGEALNLYFTNLHDNGQGGVNSNVLVKGQTYLLNDEDVYPIDNYLSYTILRNNLDGTHSIIRYEVIPGEDIAKIQVIEHFDEVISAGESVEMELTSNDSITWKVEDGAVVVNNNTVAITDDYTYAMYSQPNHCHVAQCSDAGTIRLDVHLLQAEYAALHFSYGYRPGLVTLFDDQKHYGVQTPHDNVPTSGNVSYSIDHAIGGYSAEDATHKVLYGTGNLDADFSSSLITVNLHMTDHDGDDFLNISDMQLTISGNQFYQCTGCTGSLDYNDNSGITDVADVSNPPANNWVEAGGVFYGPEANEVAGSIKHTFEDTIEENIEVIFIGKQD